MQCECGGHWGGGMGREKSKRQLADPVFKMAERFLNNKFCLNIFQPSTLAPDRDSETAGDESVPLQL